MSLCSNCFWRQQDLKGHHTKALMEGNWNDVQLLHDNDMDDLEILEEKYENDVESEPEEAIDFNGKKWTRSHDLQDNWTFQKKSVSLDDNNEDVYLENDVGDYLSEEEEEFQQPLHPEPGDEFVLEYSNENEVVVEEENDNEFANAVNNDGKKDYHENSFLELLDEFEKEEYQNGLLSDEMEAAIKLLLLLQKCNASFQLYLKISKWAEHFVKWKVQEITLREGILKTLSKCYHLDCLKPYKSCCVLPTTNLQFDVVMNCFLSSLFSLLTDESLM